MLALGVAVTAPPQPCHAQAATAKIVKTDNTPCLWARASRSAATSSGRRAPSSNTSSAFSRGKRAVPGEAGREQQSCSGGRSGRFPYFFDLLNDNLLRMVVLATTGAASDRPLRVAWTSGCARLSKGRGSGATSGWTRGWSETMEGLMRLARVRGGRRRLHREEDRESRLPSS